MRARACVYAYACVCGSGYARGVKKHIITHQDMRKGLQGTVFDIAVKEQNEKMVDKLIAAGADVNAAFVRFGRAVVRGEWEGDVIERMMDKLITAGANVNTTFKVVRPSSYCLHSSACGVCVCVCVCVRGYAQY